MRIIARSTLVAFSAVHPEARVSLDRWVTIVKAARWSSMSEVQGAFSSAVVLNWERVRFEVHGGDYRLIVAFKFGTAQVAFVKFIGTHPEYDRIDPFTVEQF